MNTSSQDLEKLKLAERAFHDSYYKQFGRDGFPPTVNEFMECFRRVHLTRFFEGGWSYWGDLRKEAFELLGDVRGKRVLDYGCGSGQLGVYLALQGARVSGFDLSGEGIEVAREMCGRYQVQADFQPLDAELLCYPDKAFDLIVGFGVLHHVVKYPRARTHVWRILKPGGRALFVETLWDNPLINWVRRFTSAEKDAGDAPLTQDLILELARPFTGVEIRKRHLLYMLKRLARLPRWDLTQPLRRRPVWKWVYQFDRTLLKIPALRSQCGEVLIELVR